MNEDLHSTQISRILRMPTRIRGKIQIETLLSLTQNVEFFRKISLEHNSTEIHKECCAMMTMEEYEKDDIIINFGEVANKFYIILKGSVSVLVPVKKKLKLTVQKYKQYENMYDKQSVVLNSPSLSSSSSSSSSDLLEKTKAALINRHHRITRINIKELIEKMKIDEEEGLRIKKPNENLAADNEEKLISQLFKEKMNKEKNIIMQVIKETNQELIEVEVDDMEVVSVLKEGNDFGELALISDRPRAATVIAREHVNLLVLHKNSFKSILGALTEKKISQKVKILKNFPYFSTWSKISLSKLAYFFSVQCLSHKQSLFTQGQKVNGIFFISQGELVLSKNIELETQKNAPYIFTSNVEKQSNNKIKLSKRMKKLKVVIKSSFESVGGYEIIKNLQLREFSCYCNSTYAEVYFVNKDILLTRFPNIEGIRAKIIEENQRLDERYSQLYEFEHCPTAIKILKTKPHKDLDGNIQLNETTTTKSYNTMAHKLKNNLIGLMSGNSNNSIQFSTMSTKRREAFRKLTETEVHEAINGRSTSFGVKKRRVMSFVRKRTPPRNFLGMYRKVISK